MRRALILLLFAASCSFAQPTVTTDDRLPPDSIELKHNEPPATSTPWQLPKPGDPFYEPAKEAQIKKENEAKVKGNSHLVRAFERGVFKGYQTLSWGSPPQRAAKEMNDASHRTRSCRQTQSNSRIARSQISQITFPSGRKHGRRTFHLIASL